jgi:hypothetical protein
MAEYIDKEKLLLSIHKAYCEECTRCDVHCRSCWVDDMRLEIADAPTADVVEVVRCRDCVYMLKHWGRVLCAKRVYSDDYSVKVLTPTNLDNFCNYGAKMDGKVLPHKFIGKSQDGECGVEILDGKGDAE